MEHLGGPGKFDCIRKNNSKVVGEIKDYRRNFNAYDLKKIIQKPRIKEIERIDIVVINGCTENAKNIAEKNQKVRLICHVKNKIDK